MDRFSAPTQRPARRLLVAVCCGVALFGSGALAWAAPPATDEAPQTFGLKDIRGSFKSGKPAPKTPSQRLGLDLATVPEVRLAAPNLAQIQAEDKANAETMRTKALRYGVGRDVELSGVDGNWYDLADGAKLWVGDVASTDAIGLRLHLSGLRLPQGAEIAVYAPSELDARSRYLKTGEVSDPLIDFYRPGPALKADQGVWTSTVVGDRARIEYFVPAGAARGRELPFTVDRLQHLYLDPVAELTGSSWEKAAGPCHNDVTCFPEWGDVARAVAGIGAIGRNAVFCSGQLVNSQQRDFTPYFLTANHCLETQDEAESVEVYWLYQTSNCGGNPPSLGSVQRSRGTTLLSTGVASDYTLLLIEGTLPNNLFWAGWNANKVSDGFPVTAIHHPAGDYKRISFGNKSSGTHFACGGLANDANHVKVEWSDAPTEPGSSGSGIFRNDTQQLLGQLHCGPSSCNDESSDSYGAFFLTYPRIKNLLKGGSDDKTEQNDTCAKAKLAKPGTLGNRIVKVTDQDWFKVNVPRGKTATVRARFANGNGDIDLKAFGSCRGGAVATSEGDGDVEEIQVTNTGRKAAFVWVQVYLFNDVRNNYDLEVSIQ